MEKYGVQGCNFCPQKDSCEDKPRSCPLEDIDKLSSSPVGGEDNPAVEFLKELEEMKEEEIKETTP